MILRWTAASAAQFRIERCTQTGSGKNKTCSYPGTALATVPGASTMYDDTTAAAGTTYKYRVRSEIDASRVSAWAETQVSTR